LNAARYCERTAPSAIHHEKIPGSVAHLIEFDGRVVFFARHVPKHEGYFLTVDGEDLLVDFHADGGLILVREHAVDEAGDQARFANAVGSQHADFFLQHSWNQGNMRGGQRSSGRRRGG